MQRAALILYERALRWYPALARELKPGEFLVRQTRSLAECREELAQAPASFVALELNAPRLDAVLSFLARLPRDFPLARAAVLAPRSLAGCEWLTRELGAVDFRTSPRCLGSLLEAVRRHLARAPAEELSFTERVWAGLPWGDVRRPL